jgi:ATPase subunit of ABC transporter with duplicated ATPase domains
MFGDDKNKTNKTEAEAKKKIEEQKRLEEEKRREEMIKRKNMERIRMENEQREKEKAKQKQMQLEKEREEFERQVENISVSEFTNLYLEGKSGELLYHSVSKPCNLKIIFLLTDVQKTIHLTFNGPNGRGGTTLIRSFRSKNFLFYEHNAQIPGQYTFYLNNYHNSDETEVIFAINDDTKTEESIGKQKVDKISGYLNEIDLKINQMRSKQNIINKKTETHNDSVNKHNKEILIYSIIEVITMLIVFAVQTFYIKSIVEKL